MELRLYSGDIAVKDPGQLRALLAPLRGYLLSGRRLLVTHAAIDSFERFLQLRGDQHEQRAWRALVDGGTALELLPPDDGATDGLPPSCSGVRRSHAHSHRAVRWRLFGDRTAGNTAASGIV